MPVKVNALFDYDCLICYNHKDGEGVYRYCHLMESNGLRCWIDSDRVPLGGCWRDSVMEAFPRCAAVVVFIGPNGFGSSQLPEWKYLSSQCTNAKKPFIPICIEGGTVPPDLLLSDSNVVELNHNPVQVSRTLKRLAEQLGAHRTEEKYDIVREVPCVGSASPAKPTCCLSMPLGKHDSQQDRLWESFREALHQLDFGCIQSIRPGDEATYCARVFEAITSSSILLADCTLDPVTRLPAPEVTFHMGLAHALGKPILILSDAPQVPRALFYLEYDEHLEYNVAAWKSEDPNAEGQLVEQLVVLLQKCRDRLRHPFLTVADQPGIGVVRGDVLTLRAWLWEPMHLLIDTGMAVPFAFRNVARSLHLLRQSVETIQNDMLLSIERELDLRQIKQGRAAYAHAHHEQVEHSINHFLACVPQHERDFEWLASGLESSRDLVLRARQFHGLLRDMIVQYREASPRVLSEGWFPDPPKACDAMRCLSDVDTLVKTVDQVQNQAYQMNACLLGLIGQNVPTEGAAHAADHTH